MIAHGPENVFYCDWGNLRRGGAVPPGADLYGLASHDRGLAGTDVGELDRPRRRWWLRCRANRPNTWLYPARIPAKFRKLFLSSHAHAFDQNRSAPAAPSSFTGPSPA